jgi:hypothetical protein
MTDPVSWFLVERGWAVVASDGKDIGSVDSVLGDANADIFDGLAVSTGVGARPVYVPSEQVGEITRGRVQLQLDAAAVSDLEPHEPPAPVETLRPAQPSFWERFTSWFRGPR